jgi:hypothetical protein
MRPLVRNPIVQYSNTDYDVLRTYLVSQFGLYCAYCEQPVTNDSAVEHKVPKSAKRGFPDFATQWRNVLLACQACNSAKSASPDKKEADDQNLGEEEWYLATADLWVWPDRYKDESNPAYPPADDIYLWIQYDLSEKSQLELFAAGLVRNTWGAGRPDWVKNKVKKIWVVPDEAVIKTLPAAKQVPTRKRIRATISGLNLNFYNFTDLKYNDRRVDNRYAAYLQATAALDQLHEIYQNSNIPIGKNSRTESERVITIVKAIREAAQATGFWSIWFTVFRTVLNAPAAGTPWYFATKDDRLELLTRTLVFYYPNERENDPTGSAPVFPGTDVTRLALDQFT